MKKKECQCQNTKIVRYDSCYRGKIEVHKCLDCGKEHFKIIR
jgi:hypothetical protein